MPASTVKMTPVAKEDSPKASHRMAEAISAGVPMLAMGARSASFRLKASGSAPFHSDLLHSDLRWP